MNRLLHFLQLRMIATWPDFGLLVLRIGFGLSLLWLHGIGKMANFSSVGPNFADPWGLGGSFTLGLVVFAEVVCAGLVVLGLFTRLAALVCAVNMFGAFYYVHQGALSGPNSGELAFTYLLAFIALALAGPGRHGLDRMIRG